ncbi:alpha/beta-hydrolase [Durotheca rogersii]|uniref:alpha/beta-hydrolase n=1 Tax=Durotheca rogersii TaxID=419775 RepID=UPI00221FFB2E|nr:alpha/beta-hydrolase [Durotheca rogersii]KAI5859803.1 alpha/beta-hydrolase [Durotheca rogersii]
MTRISADDFTTFQSLSALPQSNMLNLSSLLALWSLGSWAATAPGQEDCPVTGVPVIAHTGEPVGKEQVYNGTNQYVTGEASDVGVLYLTDVFGIQLPQNKLLADSFGRAGYITVAPDLFNGTPAPGDINGQPSFNLTKFLADHRPEITDPIIATAIDFLRAELGVEKVAVTGYCFGGRYAFRVLAEGKGADVGFTAHPSLLEDAEISAITGPISVAAADGDDLLPPERRLQIEAELLQTGLPYSVALYGGTRHGFGVRANVSNPQEKFGKEEAFFQAIRWFRAWA